MSTWRLSRNPNNLSKWNCKTGLPLYMYILYIYIYIYLPFLLGLSLLVSKCDKLVHWVPLPSLLRSLAARHLKEISRWRADHPIRWQRTAMFQQHMTPWESVRNISAVHLAVIATSALGIFKFQACKDCGVTPQFASSTLAFILDIETLRLLLSSSLKFENRMFYYFLMLCFLHWLWAQKTPSFASSHLLSCKLEVHCFGAVLQALTLSHWQFGATAGMVLVEIASLSPSHMMVSQNQNMPRYIYIYTSAAPPAVAMTIQQSKKAYSACEMGSKLRTT